MRPLSLEPREPIMWENLSTQLINWEIAPRGASRCVEGDPISSAANIQADKRILSAGPWWVGCQARYPQWSQEWALGLVSSSLLPTPPTWRMATSLLTRVQCIFPVWVSVRGSKAERRGLREGWSILCHGWGIFFTSFQWEPGFSLCLSISVCLCTCLCVCARVQSSPLACVCKCISMCRWVSTVPQWLLTLTFWDKVSHCLGTSQVA